MNIRVFEARLAVLEAAKKKIEQEKEQAEEAIEIRRLDDKLIEVGGQITEVKNWLDAYDDDPNWGQYVKRADGQRVPKLPTFKSKEEREFRMENPEGNEPGEWDEERIRRAREYRAREDAQESAIWLDGKSPHASSDE
jgi:hypothetical protein